MARLGDNPIKNPLAGNELLAADDPSTSDDVCLTPVIITQFAQANMGIANGSTQGLMSSAMAEKLNALPDPDRLSSDISDLSEVAIPVFVGAPSNGFVAIYQHVCDVPWQFDLAVVYLSAGSTILSIQKNGASIVGMANIAVNTTPQTIFANDTAPNETFNFGDTLGLNFASTVGGTVNLLLSIRANAVLP